MWVGERVRACACVCVCVRADAEYIYAKNNHNLEGSKMPAFQSLTFHYFTLPSFGVTITSAHEVFLLDTD